MKSTINVCYRVFFHVVTREVPKTEEREANMIICDEVHVWTSFSSSPYDDSPEKGGDDERSMSKKNS